MLTGKALVTAIIGDLTELGLLDMAKTLDGLYQSPKFLEIDSLTLLAEVIGPELVNRTNKRVTNRLKKAHLLGCPEDIERCKDDKVREYKPSGVPEALASLDFIRKGYNVCILGRSDSGKTYLAKALGLKACRRHTVGYYHAATLLEEMAALKKDNYIRYQRKIKSLLNMELVILDDFLLHTLTEERKVKILFELLEKRSEALRSTIVCSQRDPASWSSMIMNDEVSANAILKRATKHYTVIIRMKEDDVAEKKADCKH